MTATVLLIGAGGREHALAAAIRGAMDPDAPGANDVTLHAAASNRNPGIARLSEEVEELDETDPEAVLEYAEEVDPDYIVIGPEAPLEAGVVDDLEEEGYFVFGPRQDLARIETDKAYQREFMEEHGIPGCPEFSVFDDAEAAAAYVEDADGDVAVKPTGLTGGKGVKVVGDQVTTEEATEYIRSSDYDRFVVEERLVGEEFTVQAIVANGEIRATPAIQDHKRAFDGDEGPNTGGMGSYSDASLALPFMTEDEYHDAVEILYRTAQALEGYCGVLYGQFMLTADGVSVVEFNARFGDPEAMNTLPVLNTSFVDVLEAAAAEEDLPQLSFAPRATVCKYAVPPGYPDDPEDGLALELEEVERDETLLFYANVDERDDGIYTTTSRAFAVVGIGRTIEMAEKRAAEALEDLGIGDLHVRDDIGTAELLDARSEHLEELRSAE